MINKAFSNNYCLFIFFRIPYLPTTEIIISLVMNGQVMNPEEGKIFLCIQDCSTMSTIYLC